MAATIGAATTGWASTQASATCAIDTPCPSNALHGVNDRLVATIEELAAHRVDSRTVGLLPEWASQPPFGEGTPWEAGYALVRKEPEHLALLFPLDQAVLVLHGHKPRPAAQLGGVLHLGELPGRHR